MIIGQRKAFSCIFGRESNDSGMILIDLQKAFDTINHDILLKQMSALRFSDRSINWFQSYLSIEVFYNMFKANILVLRKLTVGCPTDLY